MWNQAGYYEVKRYMNHPLSLGTETSGDQVLSLLKWRLLGGKSETGSARNEMLANQRMRGVLVGPCQPCAYLNMYVLRYMEAVYTRPKGSCRVLPWNTVE